MEEAHLIVFLYDFSNLKTLDKIQTDFLEMQKHFKNCYDLVIVGNKIDLLDQNTQYNIINQDKNLLKKLFQEHKINFVYEFISCKKNFNINHLFFTIISCVVYPFKPLLTADNSLERVGVPYYKDKFDKFSHSPFQFFNEYTRKALIRVFRILNKSCENFGIISKREFMNFHKEIFGKKLDDENLTGIADFVNDNVKLYIDSYYEKIGNFFSFFYNFIKFF